jgi:electron transfer flavoprotein beta subunit
MRHLFSTFVKTGSMNILVCISNVPDTTTRITFTADHTLFNTSGVQFILNPYDELALSRAVELCENGRGTVTVIHVGDASSEPVIRKALAIGADAAVRIDTVPSDSSSTAHQLAAYLADQSFDMILTGRESIDYNGNAVGVMLAELLGIPAIPVVKKLDVANGTAIVEKEIEAGVEVIEVKLPFLTSCAEGVAEPKIPNMRGIMSARTKPLTVIPPADTPAAVRITRFDTPPQRSSVKMVPADQVEELVNLLHTEARII